MRAGLRASRLVWLLAKKTDEATPWTVGRMRWLRTLSKDSDLRARFWHQMRALPLSDGRSRYGFSVNSE